MIVLTYNARPLIDDCLAALATQTYTDFEVIVVDNASPDATAEYVRDHHPEVRLVVPPTNGGYGAGNNLGAAHARGEILAFLNPDAIANPHWLSNLLSSMRQHRSRFATSKIVLQSNPNRLNSGGNEIH